MVERAFGSARIPHDLIYPISGWAAEIEVRVKNVFCVLLQESAHHEWLTRMYITAQNHFKKLLAEKVCMDEVLEKRNTATSSIE